MWMAPTVLRSRKTITPEESSDDVLAARALNDRQAFGLLYDRYVDAIYRYCAGRLASREEPEDATSLIFSRALVSLPTHRGGSFRSWLFSIAHNTVLNARRDTHHHQPLDLVIQIAAISPSVEDEVADMERRRQVSEALALLPDDHRRVVELRLAGFTGPEIAATMGRSHDAVRTTQGRAISRLRALLGVSPGAQVGREGRHAI